MKTITNTILTPSMLDDEQMSTLGGVYEDGRLVRECLRPDYGVWKAADPDELPEITVEHHLEEGLYCGRFFTHFGHFLVDTLPMLHWATGYDGPLLWHPWPGHLTPMHTRMQTIRFMLEALEISEDRHHFVGPATAVGRLIVPEFPRFVTGEHQTPVQDIFSRIAAHAPKLENSPQKVYFSRREFQGQKRAAEIEAGLEAVFVEKGFRVVHPQTLPIEEQVAIAHGARVIAGVDGSALHLCAFMKPHGHCVVLKTRRTPAIASLNDAVGVKTTSIEVDKIVNQGDAPVTLDAEKLRKELKSINI